MTTLKQKKDVYSLGKTSYKCSKSDEEKWILTFRLYINTFLRNTFFDNVPAIEVKNNKRLRNAAARFLSTFKKSISIEVSNRLVVIANEFKDNEDVMKGIEAILRHEAIHHALFSLKAPFSDGTQMFESIIALTNSMPSCATPNKYLVKGSTTRLKYGFKMTCPQCKKVYNTTTNSDFYCCATCEGEVSLTKGGPYIEVWPSFVYGDNFVLETSKTLVRKDAPHWSLNDCYDSVITKKLVA